MFDLGYNALKRRIGSTDLDAARGEAPTMTFVELAPAPQTNLAEYIVELEDPRGAKMRILVAVEPADFRKGIDGLARLCQEALKQNPFGGGAFVFRNRRAARHGVPGVDAGAASRRSHHIAAPSVPGAQSAGPAGQARTGHRFRCNLCGKVFTARAPEGAGSAKYDVTSASMIALLKYGIRLPHRAARTGGATVLRSLDVDALELPGNARAGR